MYEPDPQIVGELSRQLNCHPVTATVLVNRDIRTLTAAREFLAGSLSSIRSPFALKDMDAAVTRLATAIADKEKILIFGDYDVDGVTSTAILLNFLRYAGADVSYYIPHRLTEGYGIQARHIARYARPNKFGLIITADCGSGSHQAVAAARRCGIDVIVTDHHTISDDIPPALAVINPKRRDCAAGLQNLAGVGVAFFLLICLRAHLRETGFWRARAEPNLKAYCDLVALGTVADMVPLVGENRILCQTGLRVINDGRRPGLAALLEAGAVNGPVLDADDIAFRLAPRLNAAGRMDHAARSVELLMAVDREPAVESARILNLLNQKRRLLEKGIFDHIQQFLESNRSLLRRRSLVLSDQNWHAGILGIVASRIVNIYCRPVILITTRDGVGLGSGRSIENLDLHLALESCRDHLEAFGGHSMAAGLKIREENISEFQTAFESAVQRVGHPDDFIPSIRVDRELDFAEITEKLVDELETLMPFGAGNPEPLFMASRVKVLSSRTVGKNHRRLVLRQSSMPNGPILNGIYFNAETTPGQRGDFCRIVFKLRWNRWKGEKTVQLVIEDMD